MDQHVTWPEEPTLWKGNEVTGCHSNVVYSVLNRTDDKMTQKSDAWSPFLTVERL
jgi:hypothetical protein